MFLIHYLAWCKWIGVLNKIIAFIMYRELLNNTWKLKNWKGPAQSEDSTGELMMLHAVMVRVLVDAFLGCVQVHA